MDTSPGSMVEHAGRPAAGQPLVSVVIPAYNAQDFIAATVRSVLAQTHAALEVIVVDDRSKDRTADVVDDLAAQDPRVRLVRLEKNFGAPAGPRNIGVAQAAGEWVAFLDADDIWHPDKLRLQLEALGRTGARFCCTKMQDFADEKELAFPPVANPPTRAMTFRSILTKPRVPTSSVVADTQLLRRHPFNEDMSYKAREDFDCWLRCHEEIGSSVKIEVPLIGYRVSANQISGSKLKMMKRHFHVLRHYRFRSGRKLGTIGAGFFTFTHMALSAYYRLVLREL